MSADIEDDATTTEDVMALLRRDAALALPRLARIPDPLPLLAALAAGGIHVVEFAFTTPGVTGLIAASAEARGVQARSRPRPRRATRSPPAPRSW
jgi:2-dehydro-3-deoxyphosphogluconate aldolase/(4S)-4-hydroxy-2-oxoglutarate aldolase